MVQVIRAIVLVFILTGCASSPARKTTHNLQQEKTQESNEDHSWHQQGQGIFR